jgi:hypothetical protein
VSGFASIVLPDDVVQAAAARANAENRSLTDVTAALLREYAAGKSWVNLPTPAGAEFDALLRAANAGLEEAMRRSGLMDRIEESRAHPERMVPLDLDAEELT